MTFHSSSVTSTAARYAYTRVTGATTVTVKSGAGMLVGVLLGNNNLASTITLYDNTAGSGTVISILNTVTGQGPAHLSHIDLAFTTGLTAVTTGALTDVTFIYR